MWNTTGFVDPVQKGAGANDCSFLLPDCSLLVSIKQLELEINLGTYEGPICSSSSITLWCKILGNWTSQHFVRRTLSFWRHSRCLCLISASSSFCPTLLISVWNDDLRMLFRKSRSRSLKTNTKCSPLWSPGGTARLHCTITNVEQEAVSHHHPLHHPLPHLHHYHHLSRHPFPPQLYQPAHPQLLRSLGSGWQTTGSSPTASSPSPQTTGCLRTSLNRTSLNQTSLIVIANFLLQCLGSHTF